ncbi:glycoside hydrolase family 32 protein [Ruminococcus albus]|uniref:Sucrose-6-phosphate hydrolase n=1 Tax=Ruminococcus albus TaxID=1264 RepID=A0A1H7GN21_RUMAL|nr:glycoside hydrolase family 32 protein [Ruminococcus albus]SEK39563.1 beta-fructofuranosidase [Ruminococcus albus]
MKNDFRQKLHLEPKSGWINDPNGLCYFKGEYHVYYQYSPDSPSGSGRKCWGHWKSPDLISWRSTGTVLFPDTPDDKDGVYSGCGFVKDDTLYLFYTGNVKEDGDHDYITSGRGANVILVTTKNGHDMSPKKILLRNSDYPAECSCHVRDPKVWEEDGRYHMVLGARTLQDIGCVLHYVSDDLENWTFLEKYTADDMGYMWECPDEFTIDGQRFLSISPQGLVHGKFDNQNVYSSGHYRMENGNLTDFTEWDKGFDFYAPQSFEAPDGRRILLGWEGIGDIPYTNPTVELGWQHCLTLPRELTVTDDGKILQNPVRELDSLRKNAAPINSGDTVKISLPFDLAAKAAGDIKVRFDNVLQFVSCGSESKLEFLNDSAGCGRDVRYAYIPELRDIRIIADKASVEVYINGGETVMSARMYPEDTEITLSAEGISGTLYELNGIEVITDE